MTDKVFYVYGEYGTMTVDVETGNVLQFEEPEYSDIGRIDIPTYEKTGPKINSGDKVMVMDLNFWTKDGQYHKLDSYSTS